MRAVVLDPSEASGFRVGDVPEAREPGPFEVSVAVHASALNQADLRRSAQHFAASERPSEVAVAGLEAAGTVVEKGSSTDRFQLGDRVMGMSGGAWAERLTTDSRILVPVPYGFDWDQAGASPVAFVTAHDALSRVAGFEAGQSVLLQGATTSAGLACVQVARELGASWIVGTTSSPEKVERLHDLGCDVVVCTEYESTSEIVMEATRGHGVDVVVDIVGSGALSENVASVQIGGTIVALGRVGGTHAELDLDEFSRKRICLRGTTFRTRTPEERAYAISRFETDFLPRLGKGKIEPVVDRVFDIDEIDEAVQYMGDRKRFGKIGLTIAGSEL